MNGEGAGAGVEEDSWWPDGCEDDNEMDLDLQEDAEEFTSEKIEGAGRGEGGQHLEGEIQLISVQGSGLEDDGGEVKGGEVKGETAQSTRGRRSSTGTNETIWCPVMDCASGPVQKMGQHLVKVHKMDRATAAQTAKKKTRASPESVKLGLPNSKKRSSGIPLFSTPSTSNTAKPTSKTPASTSTLSSQATSFHSGGAFLEAPSQDPRR